MKKIINITKEEPALRRDGSPIEGENQRGKWKLWHILDEQGNKYSVFANVLDEAGVKVGDTVEVTYTSVKIGDSTRHEVSAIRKSVPEQKPAGTPKQANPEASDAWLGQIAVQLTSIGNQLAKITRALKIDEKVEDEDTAF